MLYNDFLQNKNRPICKWVHYFPIYERHFERYVSRPVCFWEIGVAKGGSLQMWKRYFGPFARIIGIDINPGCKAYEEDQISIYIGNQADTAFLQSIIDECGQPDIVLDDGSHNMKHVCATFNFLYNNVANDGVYMVEDLHTAYWDEFNGGCKRKGTFIELCKDMIDSLNSRHIRELSIDHTFANSTYSMSFYDSVVVFEKLLWTKDSLKSLTIPIDEEIDVSLFRVIDNKLITISELSEHNCCIFGAGKFGAFIGNNLTERGLKINYYIDNDKAKHGNEVNGIKVTSIDTLTSINDCFVIIAINNNMAAESVLSQVRVLGILEKNILCPYIVDKLP